MAEIEHGAYRRIMENLWSELYDDIFARLDGDDALECLDGMDCGRIATAMVEAGKAAYAKGGEA